MTHYQKILLILMIALLSYTFWPKESDKIASVDRLEINSNSAGQLSIMGIILGTTILQVAEKKLQEQPHKALFITPHPDKENTYQLEAYFEDHKLVLAMAAPDSLLKKIERNAQSPFITPAGIMKLGIAAQELSLVNALPVTSLTYLSPNRIDLATFEQQHGKIEETIIDRDQNTHYLYPSLGLDFIRPITGSDILQFVLVEEFNQLRDPLVTNTVAHQATASN